MFYAIDGNTIFYFDNIRHDFFIIPGGRLPYPSQPGLVGSQWFAGADVSPSRLCASLGLSSGAWSIDSVSSQFVDSSPRVSGLAVLLVRGSSSWQEYSYDWSRDLITGILPRSGSWFCPSFVPEFLADVHFESSYTSDFI